MNRPAQILAIVGLLSALATPALACEWHGAGGWGGSFHSKWGNFAPRAMAQGVDVIDPFADDLGLANADMLDAEMGDASMMTPLPQTARTKPKPSFANVADRASRTARARVFGAPTTASNESETERDTDNSASEANAEAVR